MLLLVELLYVCSVKDNVTRVALRRGPLMVEFTPIPTDEWSVLESRSKDLGKGDHLKRFI